MNPMKIYNSNPYRVLGIKANADAPEKQKVKNRIAAYIKVGKPPVLDFDLSPPLEKIIRTQELIDLKSNEILSDEDKIKHGLFWFVSGGIVDDIALSNLTEAKDIDKALANFEKGSQDFVVSERSISSIINHSSLEIICYPKHKDRTRLKTAINRKLDIASSDRYLSLLLKSLNPNNTSITSRVLKPQIIETSKNLLKDLFRSQKEEDLYLEFFSDQKDIIEEIQEKNKQIQIRTIKQLVRECENKREIILNNESGKSLLNKSAEIGDNLLTKTESLLEEMKKSYGSNSMSVSNIYEEVFTEVNYCCVVASNMFQESFNRMTEQDITRAAAYVKNNGKSCYEAILNLNNRSYNLISSINTPIRNQIKQNLEVVRSTRNNWRQIYDTVSAARSSTNYSGGASGSSGSEDYSGFISLVVVVVVIIIFANSC
jgi:hypothetical protein